MAAGDQLSKDPEVLAYLREKGVAGIFNDAVAELIKERPDDARKFMAAYFGKPGAAAAPAFSVETPPPGGILVLGHPGSANSIPLLALGLKNLGDKFKFQFCDIQKGFQMSPEFLAINPFHHVPSAKTADGKNLIESGAILRYVARTYAPELYPEDKRGLIDMALDARATELYKKWSPLGYYAMGIKQKPDADVAKKLHESLDCYAKVFLKGKFIGGDSPCIADYYVVSIISNLALPGVAKTSFKLPECWAKFLDGMKEHLGPVYEQAFAAHNGWIASCIDKIEAVEFEKYEPAAPSSDWKADAPPDGGMAAYVTPGSNNCVSVMIMGQKHLGDKFKLQICDIMKGEQMSADFLGINPYHHIPSGKMASGQGLFEHAAMLRHMARQFAPDLYPPDKQFFIDMMLEVRQYELYPAWGPVGYHAMMIRPAPPAKADVDKFNGVLENMQKCGCLTEKFLCGDKTSIADYSVFPLINTLSSETAKKMGYVLAERWVKYYTDMKAEIGEVYDSACGAHNGWVGANVDKVGTIA